MLLNRRKQLSLSICTTLLENFQYESTIQMVKKKTGQANANTMDVATFITLVSPLLLPSHQLAALFLCSPGEEKRPPKGNSSSQAERQGANFYPELSLPAEEHCPQRARSLAPTASTAILLWHSLLPPLHKQIPASMLFFCSLYAGSFLLRDFRDISKGIKLDWVCLTEAQ